jgi:hypothetical protein
MMVCAQTEHHHQSNPDADHHDPVFAAPAVASALTVVPDLQALDIRGHESFPNHREAFAMTHRSRASGESPQWLATLSGFCDPVAAGIMLAALGVGLVVDVGGLVLWVEKGLTAPTPLLAAASALVVSGVYWSSLTETSD